MSLLHTTDVEGSKAFYGAVFGWQTETFGAPEGEITLWRLPGYVGGEPDQPVPRDVVGGMTPIGGDSGPITTYSHWSVDFWVHEADATAEHTARLGGTVIVPPHDTPGFRSAVLMDSQGAIFSVNQLTAGP
jgi:predicted enzyme related to lactoylglutathione lyase